MLLKFKNKYGDHTKVNSGSFRYVCESTTEHSLQKSSCFHSVFQTNEHFFKKKKIQRLLCFILSTNVRVSCGKQVQKRILIKSRCKLEIFFADTFFSSNSSALFTKNKVKMPNFDNVEGSGSDRTSDLPSLQSPSSPSGSPTRQSFLSEMMEVQHFVANLTLAHEIVVNEDFRFEQNHPPKDSLEGRVKDILHRAFWDSLQAQLSLSPPDYTNAITLLQEVKDTLLSLLLPGHTRLRAQLEEFLDLSLIQQQADHGALDLCRLSGYIIDTMASLCAPVRDPEIRKLRDLSDPVNLLREIFRVLGLMKMDMVNFTMQSLKPHLLQQAVQYERAKFQEILKKQPASLDNTTAWLQEAVLEAVPASVTSPDLVPPEGGSPQSTGPASPSVVLNRAYIRLLIWDPENQQFPETVLMDRARVESLGQAVKRLVLEASVLLVTCTQCGDSVLTVPGFVGKLKQTVTALLEGSHNRGFDLRGALLGVGEQVQKQVSEVLTARGGTTLPQESESLLKGQILGLAEDDSPVRTLIAARVQGYLQAVLGSQVSENGPAVPPALALVARELARLGEAFGRIVHFNRLVFGPFYSSILKKLLLPEGEAEAGLDSR